MFDCGLSEFTLLRRYDLLKISVKRDTRAGVRVVLPNLPRTGMPVRSPNLPRTMVY